MVFRAVLLDNHVDCGGDYVAELRMDMSWPKESLDKDSSQLTLTRG